MSCTIALNSFPDNSSSILYPTDFNHGRIYYIKPIVQYTTITTKDLVHNLSMKTKKAILKINSFENLQDNWDSYGALRPSELAITKSINFLRLAEQDGLEVFFTSPGVNGEVMLEYKLSDRISAEIYFNDDGTNELLIYGDNECITEGTIENNYPELLNYINDSRTR